MRLFSVPPGAPFLDVLARRWMAECGGDELSRGLILLPTRRAARALAEAFLRVSEGRPLLLPRITAFGAVDEAPLALSGTLDLPPAVAPAQRLAALSALILGLPPEQGGVRTADRAWMLAAELAVLMDEAERMELDLPAALARATDAEHAEHWRITLDFLAIVTRAWPNWLAANGLSNPAARQVKLLRSQALAWQEVPPDMPVWVAGTTAGVPAVAALLKVVAGLRDGLVVLPGLDHAMDDDAWNALEVGHPQAGLRALLAGLGARREDVTTWDDASAPALAPARAKVIAAALLPAPSLRNWGVFAPIAIPGLWLLGATDEQEEAAAIALILRDAIEEPGARAALVTPDRALAGRVAAELLRWGVVADDSAGEPLAATPPAVFLRLIADAVEAGLAPAKLLAMLKHPLAAAGLSPGACRAAARGLELAGLRGPKPAPGIAGLRQAIAGTSGFAENLLARVEAALAPMLRVVAARSAAPRDMLAALVAAGEALATSDEEPGPGRLWAMEEGEALATALAEALEASALLPEQAPSVLPALLDAMIEGIAVRSRRALRGRGEGSEHPRVFIWGLLEARLQTAEVMVLGGLVEGVWPPASDPGPWMSRPMRAKAGLPSPEERIGQTAHDFVMAATAAATVVLSCPRRRGGAPAVPARWLVRLEAFLRGRGQALPRHPAAGWARRLDQPAGAPQPAKPPTPRPDVRLRPRRLRVTEVQTWIEDPYAIYAKHVLRLNKLKPLEEATDAADYGTLVHRGMQIFLDEFATRWPPDAEHRLGLAMDRALQERRLRPALAEWWAPRLRRISTWVAARETTRRAAGAPAAIVSERGGQWELDGAGGAFVLRGRADRIERREDGRLSIFDYKTGTLPSQKAVASGFAPQLPLEAAMAAAGAFGADVAGDSAELIYWHLTGGFDAGSERSLFKGVAEDVAAAAAIAREKLRALITAFDDPARAYLSQPHPGRAPRFSDYAQLARVAEWDADDAEEEA